MNILGKQINCVLCLGVGGVGVGPIAMCLQQHGVKVIGYDSNDNAICESLRDAGAVIVNEASAELLTDEVDAVVYSSAIPLSHPVLLAAQNKGVLVMLRAKMLGELLRLRHGIAVAGTHGKTTTSSMLAFVLYSLDKSTSWLVGGKLQNTQSYMHWEQGKYLVVEADESDGSLIELKANTAVLTNCEPDHLVNFAGDFKKLQNSFLEFLRAIPLDGAAIVNADDAIAMELVNKAQVKSWSFGFSDNADYQIRSYQQHGLSSHFDLQIPTGEVVQVIVNLPGKHNVCNATAAIACAHSLGFSIASLVKAIASFTGVGRRFTICGKYVFRCGVATLINDYGHHPTEIAATIQAARASYPGKRLVLVFQPHRYTRTQELFADFALSFSGADLLLLPDTFSAGEDSIANCESEDLVAAISAAGHHNVFYIGDLANVVAELDARVNADDVVILQGAGSIGYIVDKFTKAEA